MLMLQKDTDTRSLIEHCKNGDRRAQEKMYYMLKSFGMSIARRYARDEQEAAAILNLALYKVLRKLEQYDSQKGIFHGWVKRIVINEGLDLLRNRERKESTGVDNDYIPESLVHNNAPAKLDRLGILAQVQRHIPDSYPVFVMQVVDGFTHREIAAILGISASTSKRRMEDARRVLREMGST